MGWADRKSTRLNSSHVKISYAVFCLKKKKQQKTSAFSVIKKKYVPKKKWKITYVLSYLIYFAALFLLSISIPSLLFFFFFFFNDPATTEIYTLSYTTLFRSSPARSAAGRSYRRRRPLGREVAFGGAADRKSTRLNSSHVKISYAVFCLKK